MGEMYKVVEEQFVLGLEN
jgi:hypothetical protein